MEVELKTEKKGEDTTQNIDSYGIIREMEQSLFETQDGTRLSPDCKTLEPCSRENMGA